MPLDETALEDALRSFVAAALAPEVLDGAVIWDRQRGPRPAPPFATLELVGPGGPWGAVPEWQHEFDPDVAGGGMSAVAGGEIVEETIHHHEYALRLKTYADAPRTARNLMIRIHDRANMRSGRDGLRESSGIVVAEVGPIQDVGALLDTDWEGRAVMTVRIRVGDMVEDRIGYVATVETVNELE